MKIDVARRSGVSVGAGLLAVSVILVGAMLVFDAAVVNRGFLEEGPPDWSWEYLLRIVLSAVVSFTFVFGLREVLPRSDTKVDGGNFLMLCLLGAPVAALACGMVLLFGPGMFTTLALEDKPVEDLTVVMLLAAMVLILAAVRTLAAGPAERRVLLIYPASMAFVGFLIAGEEISWGQRIFSFSTPQVLEANDQAEANLHNLATGLTENTYYFSAFAALVIGAMIASAWVKLPEILRPFGPTVLTALGAAPAFAFAYDMWNIGLTQFAFFGSIAVLVLWAPGALRDGQRGLLLLSLTSVVVVQVIMLARGGTSNRLWDTTEYRELFISVGLFIYAWSSYRRAVWASGQSLASPT